MKIENSRDMLHNYRILSEGMTPERNSYVVRMLTDNRIPGFLSCQIREVDTRMQFLYDVTSMQSLADMLVTDKISGSFLELLYTSLIQAMKNLEEFLLDEQGILLRPELIFMNAEKTALYFIYYPDQALTFSGQLKTLGESLLPHLDHADKQSVIMGYTFYQRTVDGDFSAETFQELLEKCQMRKPEEEMSAAYETEEDKREKREQREQREKILEEFFNEEEHTEEGVFARVRNWFRRKKHPGFEGDPDKSGEEEQTEGEERTEVHGRSGDFFDVMQKDGPDRNQEAARLKYISTQNRTGSMAIQDDGTETMLLAVDSGQGEKRIILAKLLPEQKDTGKENRNRRVCTEAYDLWKPHHILGKSRNSSDLILEVPTVSRIHARFVQKEDGYHIIDMNSKNGTFLNEKMLVS